MSTSSLNNSTSPDASQVDIGDAHVPVVVNLRAAISASADINVFGPSEESVTNVIVCDTNLDVSGLYSDPSNALIEFWEPSDAPHTINARIARDTRNAQWIAQIFAVSLAKVIKGGMDASAANPFQSYPGPAYTKYDNFGELALSYAAEGMFGHPSATAAITNDNTIITSFNSDASKLESITSAVLPSQTDQALAQRLAAALYDSSDNIATAIAQVVLGQDASRATNVDNSALQVNRKAPLRFYIGDIIYVKITLENFTSSIGAPGKYLLQGFTPPKPPTQDYYLRITVTSGTLIE